MNYRESIDILALRESDDDLYALLRRARGNAAKYVVLRDWLKGQGFRIIRDFPGVTSNSVSVDIRLAKGWESRVTLSLDRHGGEVNPPPLKLSASVSSVSDLRYDASLGGKGVGYGAPSKIVARLKKIQKEIADQLSSLSSEIMSVI